MILLAPHLAQAEDASPPIPPVVTVQDCSVCGVLDVPRDFLSTHFMTLSEQLDMFFSNTPSAVAVDNSSASISAYAIAEEGALPRYQADTRVFLAMPRTQQKLALIFQSESTSSELDVNSTDVVPGSPQRQTTALALRGDISTSTDWSLYADIGSEFRGFIDPFLRVTYTQNFQLTRWQLAWSEAVFRFGYRGNGITSGLRMDRPIDERFHFRVNNQAIWYQTGNFIDRSHSSTLFHKLNETSALAYSLGLYTTSDPTDYVYYAQLRYRKLIHQTWLFFEVIPELLYPESMAYLQTPRLTLKLEVMLGKS